MSARAEWLVGIVGVVGAALGVLFFVATQEITWRDVIVLLIGAFVGGMIVALVAVWRFHADERATAAAAHIAAAEARANADFEQAKDADRARQKAAQTLADAEADAVRTRAVADADATLVVANARAAQVAKQTELLGPLPTRRELIEKLHNDIAVAEQSANTARGNADVSDIRGREAEGHGFWDDAREHEEAANNWRINFREFTRRVPVLRGELDRIEALTDEEFLAEQRHERGLD